MQDKICGIYKFTSKTSGKSYIGQSVDILKRFNEHRMQAFNKNVHHFNCHFYRAIRKYGFSDFSFQILEECPRIELNQREQYWISFFDTYQNGYNMTTGGEDNPSNNPEVVKKRTNTLLHNPEVNKKLASRGGQKISLEEVVEIRTAYKEGKKFGDVYPKYLNKIGRSAIQKIWLGKSFPEIMPEVYQERKTSSYKGGCTPEDGEIVFQMRLDRMSGIPVKEIAQKYRISKKYASDILSLHHWKEDEFIPQGYIEYVASKTKAKLDDDIMYRLSEMSVSE